MNKMSIVIIAATALISGVAIADDAHHPDKSKATTPAAPDDRRMRQQQETMLRMHDLMHKIQQARDPKERATLMQEHMKAMREGMSAMHDMMGNGAQPMGQMGGAKTPAPAK